MVWRATEESHTSICKRRERNRLESLKESVINILFKGKQALGKSVPHLLPEEQKKQRVACSYKLLGMFGSDGIRRLRNIITGDETRIYLCPQQMVKSHNCMDGRIWTQIRAEIDFFSLISFALINYGPLAVDMLPDMTTLIATYYNKPSFQSPPARAFATYYTKPFFSCIISV